MTLLELKSLLFSSISVSSPALGWVLCGVLLRRLGWLSSQQVTQASAVTFKYGLPVMLFSGAVLVDLSTVGDADYLFAGLCATVATLLLAVLYGLWRGLSRPVLGVFAQAAFRSNLAIIGVAMVVSAYGAEGLAVAALAIAVMTVFYNILAVVVLSVCLGSDYDLLSIIREIARNPLILGIAAGFLVAALPLPIPAATTEVSLLLSAIVLPITLVCVGATMQFSQLRSAGRIVWEASLWRLVVAPGIGVFVALLWGVSELQLGVLFLLLASPVAAASFVMVVAAKGDGALAANIIVLTTLLSIVTVTLGFFLLSLYGVIA